VVDGHVEAGFEESAHHEAHVVLGGGGVGAGFDVVAGVARPGWHLVAEEMKLIVIGGI